MEDTSVAATKQQQQQQQQEQNQQRPALPVTTTKGPEEEEEGGDEEEEEEEEEASSLSLFDTSVVDTSQATTLTEPDTEVMAPSPPRPRRQNLTREEARQKAEILRLRLGLAGYKLRTGQEDIPLERLQIRHGGSASGLRNGDLKNESQLPRLPSGAQQENGDDVASSQEDSSQPQPQSAGTRKVLPVAEACVPEQEPQRPDQCVRGSHAMSHAHAASPEKNLLPRLPPMSASLMTPGRARAGGDEEDKLTSSAIKGGAANGLLSLARG
jgi:hypothetical protein